MALFAHFSDRKIKFQKRSRRASFFKFTSFISRSSYARISASKWKIRKNLKHFTCVLSYHDVLNWLRKTSEEEVNLERQHVSDHQNLAVTKRTCGPCTDWPQLFSRLGRKPIGREIFWPLTFTRDWALSLADFENFEVTRNRRQSWCKLVFNMYLLMIVGL